MKTNTLNIGFHHWLFNPFKLSCFQSLERFIEESTTKDNQYIYEVSLPAFRKKDIQISIKNNRLIVEGKAKTIKRNFWGKVKNESECSIYEQIALIDDMDIDRIDAKFNKQKLRITIPKIMEKSKTIPISG